MTIAATQQDLERRNADHDEHRSYLPQDVVLILGSLNESFAEELAWLLDAIRQLDGAQASEMERIYKISDIETRTTAALIRKEISVDDCRVLINYASKIPLLDMLPYSGLADVTLVFGEAPGLGRTAEWTSINVEIRRSSASSHIEVEVGRQLGVDLLKGPTISHVTLTLEGGCVLIGTIRMIAASGQYFELNPDVPVMTVESQNPGMMVTAST